jgi:DNA invertase Pin-like site-specific DNA recombinase
MKEFVRDKDVVVFAELDRLGRTKKDIDDELNELIKKGVDIVVLDMPILDTTKYQDELGKLILNITKEIFSYIAEKERLDTLERQRQGIQIAKR